MDGATIKKRQQGVKNKEIAEIHTLFNFRRTLDIPVKTLEYGHGFLDSHQIYMKIPHPPFAMGGHGGLS